jgi:hypothetical protein
MKPMKMQRYEALVGYSRLPHAKLYTREVAWFSSKDEELIATVLLDFTDRDYNIIILGRDLDQRYRCIKVIPSVTFKRCAIRRLKSECKDILASGEIVFPQGDEKGKKIDLFNGIYPDEKLNENFKRVRDSVGYSSAKEIIQEMMHHYRDIDGNYAEQFQTTGFDSRLWELYLFAYLNEENLLIDRTQHAPDFVVSNGQQVVAIEAVIVQGSPDGKAEEHKIENLTPQKIIELQKDYMPIKFGSPLFSKLKKKYWDLPNVNGKPLVFAIADFHQKQSMMWSSTALLRYLYGVHHDFHKDENGQLIITPIKIDFHEYKGKKIPSGFFFTKDSEHVSAVLFSASGTISKFLRMGKIAGFGDKKNIMLYHGLKHKHDANSALPEPFKFIVDESYEENWAHGVSIFHNPNALIPLEPSVFPSATHHYMQEDGNIVSELAEFHPYSSMTSIIIPTP